MNLSNLAKNSAIHLKTQREKKNLSHEALLKRLNDEYGFSISRDSLMNYEKAEEYESKFGSNLKMNCTSLLHLSDFYGVSTDYLLGLTDVEYPSSEIRATCDFTGLSEDAVISIRNLSEGDLHILNTFTSAKNGKKILRNFLLAERESYFLKKQAEEIDRALSNLTLKDLRTAIDVLQDLETEIKRIEYELFEDILSFTSHECETADAISRKEKTITLINEKQEILYSLLEGGGE